jgi:hypothetical protein
MTKHTYKDKTSNVTKCIRTNEHIYGHGHGHGIRTKCLKRDIRYL